MQNLGKGIQPINQEQLQMVLDQAIRNKEQIDLLTQ